MGPSNPTRSTLKVSNSFGGYNRPSMAKFKSAGSKKATPAKSARSAIPCLVLVILGIVLMCLLFYYSLRSNAS